MKFFRFPIYDIKLKIKYPQSHVRANFEILILYHLYTTLPTFKTGI